ncbi:hypothetical protein RSAG8_05866, partial [Rhizoctonia solani AG-8 WAC10335]
MSAYGTIAAPSSRSEQPLKALSYVIQNKPENSILIMHLTKETAPNDLVGLLHKEFGEELERGQTYPPRSGEMSAYGTIATPSGCSGQPLKALSYVIQNKPENSILIMHLTKETAPNDLVGLLHKEFGEELERGQTYPQEGPMDRAAFEAYFFAADAFVGVIIPSEETVALQNENIERVRAGRGWDESIVGSYYVKPNYPGRSSHICNAGFVVRTRFRRLGLGKLLGESYVRNAPQLGYKASVFNLVYANNVASLAIWDRLGFTRAGLIPKAGRLKTENGEEYFDAVLVYKSFED